MYYLGKRADLPVSVTDRLKEVIIVGRPTTMPNLAEDEALLFIFSDLCGGAEKVVICVSLEEMLMLHEKYGKHSPPSHCWYTAFLYPIPEYGFGD